MEGDAEGALAADEVAVDDVDETEAVSELLAACLEEEEEFFSTRAGNEASIGSLKVNAAAAY